jgi:hydroxypyruvate reductase
MAVLSAGTDGMDGNSPAAGAVADGETLARAHAANLNPQRAFRGSDAYTFFQRLDDAIITGPTGNNLRDLRILIAER